MTLHVRCPIYWMLILRCATLGSTSTRRHHKAPEEAEEPPAAAVAAAGFFVKKPMSDGWALRAVSTLLRLLPAALTTTGALALVLAAGAFVAGVVAAARTVFSAAGSGLFWVPSPGCKLSPEGASARSASLAVGPTTFQAQRACHRPHGYLSLRAW